MPSSLKTSSKALCGPLPSSNPSSIHHSQSPGVSGALGTEPRSSAASSGKCNPEDTEASEHTKSHLKVLVAQPHGHEVSVHWEELHSKLVLSHHGVQAILQVPQVKLHRLTECLHGCQQQDRQVGPEGPGLEPLLPGTLGVTEFPPLYSVCPCEH